MHEHPPQVRASPIFPVRDLRRSLEHYAALGCTVSTHDDGYGFAARGGVELHLVVVSDDDPRRGPVAAYLHVPDADALAAEWADVPGTSPPVDTDYGLREGRHVDPDGNLLRFGSPIRSAG
jgi:catechol 2,3-dioxygenase-like lactoylglutathione lyase family enzyme